jgi:hypothetical protein
MYASFLPFKGDEGIQLCKCPARQPTFIRQMFALPTSSHLRDFTNIREVFKDDSTAWESILHDAF